MKVRGFLEEGYDFMVLLFLQKSDPNVEKGWSMKEKRLHTHTHQNTKAVVNRLSRAIGHMEAVKRMVEDGKDCSEVLIQLSAVIAALHNTGKVILTDHISHCIVDAVESGDKQAIEDLNIAISRFMK